MQLKGQIHKELEILLVEPPLNKIDVELYIFHTLPKELQLLKAYGDDTQVIQ